MTINWASSVHIFSKQAPCTMFLNKFYLILPSVQPLGSQFTVVTNSFKKLTANYSWKNTITGNWTFLRIKFQLSFRNHRFFFQTTILF